MAETQLKRPREEEEEEDTEYIKRQKSYKDILSLLEEEADDEPYQDLSSLITTLQQEISSPTTAINDDQAHLSTSTSDINPVEEGEGETEKVMRHLLEASDDELGIPNADAATAAPVDGGDLLLPVSLDGGDGLWEIEDEAANYYALLQSELFM